MRFGGGSGWSGPGEGGPRKKWEAVRVRARISPFFPLPTYFFFQFSEIFRGIEVVSARFLHNTHFGRSRRAED